MRHHRQRPRLTRDIPQDRADQARLKRQPDELGGTLDRVPQLGVLHRPDERLALLEHDGKPRIRRAVAIEVRAQHKHHGRCRSAQNAADELTALGLVRAQGEDLLELIDDQHARPWRPIDERLAQALQRTLTRRDDHRHVSAPTSRGSNPARTSDDLPLPDGPTTARTERDCKRSTSSSTSCSRPKNKPPSSA